MRRGAVNDTFSASKDPKNDKKPVRIELYDTSLRDGAQSEGVSFSLNDKLAVTYRLDDLGIDYIEGGYPASNEKDKAYFERVSEKKPSLASICAVGMTRRKGVNPEDDLGLAALVESNAEIVTVVGKSSAFQAKNVLGVSLEENLAMIDDTLRFVARTGKRVFYDAEHFFDGWKDDPEYSLETLRAAVRAGAEAITLCDTNGGSMPNEIAAGVSAALEAAQKVSPDRKVIIGIHTHNDCGLAVANTLAAVEAGATLVQGTINGLGERCGNADLLVVAANLSLKFNGKYETLKPGALERLTQFSRFMYELTNIHPNVAQPYVGASAFAHKGGMHVNGINKDSKSYEHVSPALVGNERRVLVSELSGKSNIVAFLKKYQLEEEAPNPETVAKILEKVTHKESLGYQYEAADGSFKLLVRKVKGEFIPSFKRLNFQTSVIVNDVNESLTTKATVATVKLRVGRRGELRHEVAEGDGPVDALNNALRKAVEPIYPELRDMKLVDYKVRVLNSDAGTAATTRVIIESKDGEEHWSTIGVSENVVEASWIALCDSIEYKLAKSIDYKDKANR
ncbi:MAG: citramalate synthase [Thermoguttaceae bacterium]|nr:citramalate synthase [Thermoguttaceae bacterium]